MKAKVTVNTKKVNGIFRALKLMGKERVLVGIPQDTAERKNEAGSRINNADIGYINENGDPARGIPARRHMQKGIKSREEDIQRLLEHAASMAIEQGEDVKNGESIQQGLNAAGLIAVAGIKEIITTQEGFDPLNPRTIKAREKRKPTPFFGQKALEVTGSYINGITYVLKSKYKNSLTGK